MEFEEVPEVLLNMPGVIRDVLPPNYQHVVQGDYRRFQLRVLLLWPHVRVELIHVPRELLETLTQHEHRRRKHLKVPQELLR